jgi:para-aminobenzoate synthetase/4-amino-4-deoxychorismate lyase
VNSAPYIFLDDQVTLAQRFYDAPVEIITAQVMTDIAPAMDKLETYLAQGYHAAGYISYEAGYAFEPKKFSAHNRLGGTPLLQFGIFSGYTSALPPGLPDAANDLDLNLKPDWTEPEYTRRFHKVIDYIKAGDVYQINLTFPMRGSFSGSAQDLYDALRRRQPGKYGGVVSLGGVDIISLSPELFFKRTGNNMDMRPMKGTARRLPDPARDLALRDAMKEDAKSQAENLMIVDLLRNDLSRLSQRGSVNVPELFSLETYPTLHQMTSRVNAKLREGVSVTSIFESLFPCGSVTGAPKIRAMEIIQELEEHPRGAYCGALGYMDPNGDACFNVGIRTLTLDQGQLTYNVGSGIVLDSQAREEYDECLLKAHVLRSPPDLIETSLWTPKDGFVRLPRHLRRLTRSARALNYPFNNLEAHEKLRAAVKEKTGPQRIRMTLTHQGHLDILANPLQTLPGQTLPGPMRLAISQNRLSPTVQESAHKVSARTFYDGERQRVQALGEYDEVLFLNEHGELCEGSFTSLFIKTAGKILTPSLTCGLLPGILREEMIETGQAFEAILTLADLENADTIYVGNSLRGLITGVLVSNTAI